MTELADFAAPDLIRWAVQTYKFKFALVTSFQREGMVLLDMAWQIEPQIRVITLIREGSHPRHTT